MKWSRDRFALVSEPSGQGVQKYWTSRCSCGFIGRVTDNTFRQMPPEAIGKKLQSRGWVLGANNNRDTCPSCATKNRVPRLHKPVLSPAQKRAAFCAINNIPRAKPKPVEVPVTTSQPAKAEPPRQPQPTDRQRVYAAIEERWDAENEAYVANWSDTSIAETLKVPRSWVADVRTLLFGPEDRNMAAAQAANEIAELRTQFEEIEKAGMASMQITMDALEKVKSALSAIERRLDARAA